MMSPKMTGSQLLTACFTSGEPLSSDSSC